METDARLQCSPEEIAFKVFADRPGARRTPDRIFLWLRTRARENAPLAFYRHHERRPVASIAVAQQPLRVFIADHLLRVGIEVDRPA
jgi:hypothetical protein